MIITAPPNPKIVRLSRDTLLIGTNTFTSPIGTKVLLSHTRRTIFRFWESKGSRAYCYTVHPDENGNYFSWTYVPEIVPDEFGYPGLHTAWRIGKHTTRGRAKKMALSYFTEENDGPPTNV